MRSSLDKEKGMRKLSDLRIHQINNSKAEKRPTPHARITCILRLTVKESISLDHVIMLTVHATQGEFQVHR